MAKILETGTKHIDRCIFKHRCTTCESLIEFDKRSDRTGDQREGDYYTCPMCGIFIAAAPTVIAELVAEVEALRGDGAAAERKRIIAMLREQAAVERSFLGKTQTRGLLLEIADELEAESDTV